NPRCTAADIDRQNALFAQQPLWVRANSADPIQLQDCQAYGGNTAGVDFKLRSPTRGGGAVGAGAGTPRLRGPADDGLRDRAAVPSRGPGGRGGGGGGRRGAGR